MLDEQVSLTENGQQRVLFRLEVIFTQIASKAVMGDRKSLALLLEYAPAIDIKLRRHLTPELLERAMVLVRGRLDFDSMCDRTEASRASCSKHSSTRISLAKSARVRCRLTCSSCQKLPTDGWPTDN
jgi:hypothetical protein